MSDTPNFKDWLLLLNPKEQWFYDDPEVLYEQIITNITETGYFDFETIFKLFKDTGLTYTQNRRFEEYFNDKN